MNLEVVDDKQTYKRLFTLKPKQRDGLVLNVHHTDKKAGKIRFIYASFNNNGQILISSDNEGNIFVVDFFMKKFWNLSKIIDSCVFLKCSSTKADEFFAGTSDGSIHVIDVQTGQVLGDLIGHKHPVCCVSFSRDFLCLTSSVCESVIWDLRTYSKVHVLNLEKNCGLKQVIFMPVTDNILACFDDNVIQVWKYGTFESIVQLQPAVWHNRSIRNVAFTMNGRTMIVVCHTPFLAVFLLNSWKLLKLVTLPEYVQTIRKADFVPQSNDGGCNKILAILCGHGTIYFYDIEQNVVISELISTYEIIRYDCLSKGNYAACVLCSGEVNVYDIVQYIELPTEVRAERAQTVGRRVHLKKCLAEMDVVKEQIKDILDIDKLRSILKEFGEYPDMYRTKIWEQLLELPNNRNQYNAVINHRMIRSFDDLYRKYPLENKRSLKNLRRLLDNLVTWCPFFANVEYLPVFVFPFVKVFQNKPLACFEAVCTVIMNWCQFWFEYFPLPPINILALTENILLEHDPDLLNHLTKNKITSKLYAWPLLETAFSEILTAPQWKTFWDHVLTNEPSFLLCGVVAYNNLQRAALLSLQDQKRLKCFYRGQHPIDVKKLVAKTYHILDNTDEKIHPRQYLNMFKKIDTGKYPDFCDYPKTIVEYQSEKSKNLENELEQMKMEEDDLFQRRIANLSRLDDLELEDEERKRIFELEKAVKQKLMDEQEQVKNYYQRLSDLRGKLLEEEDKILELSKGRILKSHGRNREKLLESLMDDIKLDRMSQEHAVKKAEDDLLLHYSELLRHKYSIEKMFDEDSLGTNTGPQLPVLHQQQEELAKEIERVKRMVGSQKHLRLLNIATGVAAMDALIGKIEGELNRDKYGECERLDQVAANLRVLKLKAETGELVMEVNKLLKLLIEVRNRESWENSSL